MTAKRRLVWLGAAALLLVGGCKRKDAGAAAGGTSDDPSGTSTSSPAATTPTPTTPTAPSLSGDYATAWGACTLTQTAASVAGVCRARGTIIACQVDKDALHCAWNEPGKSGKAELKRQADGRLLGTYGAGASATNGGPWNFTPKK